jgi:hypothetical protein
VGGRVGSVVRLAAHTVKRACGHVGLVVLLLTLGAGCRVRLGTFEAAVQPLGVVEWRFPAGPASAPAAPGGPVRTNSAGFLRNEN